MSVPMTVAATIRGRAAFDEVRALFDQLVDADQSIRFLEADIKSDAALTANWPFHLTYDEMHDVLTRRRDAIVNKLENKGIRIAPDPAPALPPGTVVEVAQDAVVLHTDPLPMETH